ncbi:MAG: TonB-dependent receptor [Cytophagales bacterium]|nr:TonB-dependent receptor [Cytophaga sp.]
MKKSILLIAFIFIFIHAAVSQQSIIGTLIDSTSTIPVEYASVTIYSTENQTLVNGQLTDSTGSFHFNGLKSGTYYVKIELIGYTVKEITNISVTKSADIDLGNIILSAKPGNEIVINGQERDVNNTLEKQVYKADQFQSANGGTALDVIKNMPSVSVNAEGEIRLRGSTGFMVMINGKPILTDVHSILSQIPANAIENIELITAPSARYDADGKAGIINITTKKGFGDGVAMILNAMVGLPGVNTYNNLENPQRHGADGSLSYKKNKWDLSIGASYLRNDVAGRRIGDVNTTVANRFTSFPSEGERSFQRTNYSGRALVQFTADKKNVFSAGIYIGQRVQYRRADIVYQNTKTDVSTGQILGYTTYFNSNLVKKQGNFSLINLDYTHTFQNKSSLTFSGLYEYALLDGYTKNLNTHPENLTDTIDYVLNTGRSPLNGFRGRIDYVIKIGKGTLESGYQLRYQKQTGVYVYQNAILGTGAFETVPEFSADIKIDQYIQGLYSQYSGKLKHLEYLAGLRYEYSNRTYNANKPAQSFQLPLSNFFPSATITYELHNRYRLKGGFSSRVQRSTSNELNPYPEREHTETLEQGDPQIKPEFVYLTELGVNKQFNSGSVFITLYNQQINNVVNRVNSVYNDTILNRIYTNAGKARLWGFETGINLKVVHWWNSYIGANVYNYKITGSLFHNTVAVNNQAVAFSFNTNQTFTLNKTVNIQFTLNYLSSRPTAQGTDSRFITPSLSVKKTFLDNRFSIMLHWQYIGLGGIIPGNQQRITTSGSDFYTTTNYIQETDIFLINLSYNLNHQNKKMKLPVSEFGEREF